MCVCVVEREYPYHAPSAAWRRVGAGPLLDNVGADHSAGTLHRKQAETSMY